MRFPQNVFLVVCVVLIALPVVTQSPNGTINGLVNDPSNRVISGADIVVVNDATGVSYSSKTNDEGIYVLPNLPPGPYRLQVSRVGFKTLIKPDIVLNVQDALSVNFTLPIGALSETVTVEGGAPLVNTESATVSTVVNRQFAENLPLNGRSFQTLIQLTPGVVLTASNTRDSGQFSVNGQRGSANYWMVDGVSANIGIGAANTAAAGNGLSGAAASFSVLGGTNSLVSVDALQEFRIQTSTYAPEFGRTPGAQISIVTRSGTNQLHGTAFDYFRNDILDAGDWFNGYTNSPPLPKAEERQNDFGGTLGGPILKGRTFFFFSYEGLRLRLPKTELSTVPDVGAREAATSSVQPYLNAFPLPNGPEVLNGQGNPTSAAQFNASFSDSASLDAYSLRIDHKLNNSLALFGRYNYSPSTLVQRGILNGALSSVFPTGINTQTATVGATLNIGPLAANDLRFNYSKTHSSVYSFLDDLGGAVPLQNLPFPEAFTTKNGAFQLFDLSLSPLGLNVGLQGDNTQRQVNAVDNLAIQQGSHSLKAGVDYRRMSPVYGNPAYDQEVLFRNIPSLAAGQVFLRFLTSSRNGNMLFHNLGVFAQDTWRVVPRLTLTYGARWDVDFAPSSAPNLLAVTGFDLDDLSNLALAPAGTKPFETRYDNIAPRVGLAYELRQSPRWQTVVRTGFGVFYDLATSEAGNNISSAAYPFGALGFGLGGDFPLTPANAAPPAIDISSLASNTLYAYDPHLRLPYTLQWNLALEQALGVQQSLSVSYVGSAGRRLIQTARINSPNSNFVQAQLVTNAATSDYDALQLQFQRRVSQGLQVLASYTWSHSIDSASAGSVYGNQANALIPGIDPIQNRGPSDFDIRQSVSLGLTYEIPVFTVKSLANSILAGWSVQSIIQARSALPVNIYDSGLFNLSNGATTFIRPDVVARQSFYLYGAQYPGGKGFNSAAFLDPPLDTNGNPVRQGSLPRNALRGFPAAQWDLAIHRDFPIHETVKLQFRAELFNVLNHPNFAPPIADISNQAQFGHSTQMLGQYLAGENVGSGGFSPLYQIGGPRSIQLALKLRF
jgi:hypothetical protein